MAFDKCDVIYIDLDLRLNDILVLFNLMFNLVSCGWCHNSQGKAKLI